MWEIGQQTPFHERLPVSLASLATWPQEELEREERLSLHRHSSCCVALDGGA